MLRSRREQLSGVVASTPKPAASQKVLTRLQQASEQLQLLQSLQVRRAVWACRSCRPSQALKAVWPSLSAQIPMCCEDSTAETKIVSHSARVRGR